MLLKLHGIAAMRPVHVPWAYVCNVWQSGCVD